VARDVIVIGSGIVGCSVAYELARRGASVDIVDERGVALGATQASAGMLVPYHEAGGDSPLLPLATASLDLYDDFIEAVSADSGVRIPYHRTGSLEVAMNDAEFAALRACADALRERGVPSMLLDRAGARTEEPHLAADVVGALLVEPHGFVAAADFTRALAIAARARGARVVEQSRVRRVVRAGSDMSVETERGTLAASCVVLAAGTWISRIDIDGPTVRVPVRPVRGQLLHLGWNGTPLRRITWSHSCYLVPWDDGTLLVGATVEDAGFDERATVAGVRDLLDGVCETVPHAWTATFRAARVGLRPATPDNLPIIGSSEAVPNLFYAAGHYRNGVLLAPVTARLLADAMLEGRLDPLLEPVSPRRFGGL